MYSVVFSVSSTLQVVGDIDIQNSADLQIAGENQLKVDIGGDAPILKRCVINLMGVESFNDKIKVESGLLQKPGIKSAAVDLQAATGEVIFDGALIKCHRCICKAVRDMGFEADTKVAAYVIEGPNVPAADSVLIQLAGTQNLDDKGQGCYGLIHL